MKHNNSRIIKINKAKIILTPIHGLKTVNIYAFIKGGFWYEKAHQGGLFHLLEHVIHNKTKKFSSIEAVEKYKQYYGIKTRASTNNGFILFSFSFPKIYISQVFLLLEQYLFEAEFEQNNIDNEKKVIEQEFITYINDSSTRFVKQWYKHLFGQKHLYAKDHDLNLKLFSTYTKKEIELLYRQFFQPQHMVFGISGNLKIDQINRRFDQILSKVRNYGQVRLPSVTNIKTNFKPFYFRDNFESCSVSFAWVIPAIKPLPIKQQMIRGLSNFLLADSYNQNSYLIKRIRHQESLVYSAGYLLTSFPKHDLFEIFAKCSEENIQKVKKVIKDTILEVLKSPITKIQLKTAIRFLNIRTMMEYDNSPNLVYNYGVELLFDKRHTEIDDYIKISKNITIDEINKYYESFLTIDTAIIAIMRKINS